MVEPITPEYSTSNDACRYLLAEPGQREPNVYRLNDCMQGFDALIEKAGGGNDSEQAQNEIRMVCDDSCDYTNSPNPDYGAYKSHGLMCYPQCILAANVVAGQASKYPEEASEIYSQFNALDNRQKLILLSKIEREAKRYLRNPGDGHPTERHPVPPPRAYNPEYPQQYPGQYPRERYTPYSPFFADSRADNPKRMMGIILFVLFVAIIVFLVMRK